MTIDFAGEIIDAADRGEPLKVRANARMLAQACRNVMSLCAGLGVDIDQPNDVAKRAPNGDLS